MAISQGELKEMFSYNKGCLERKCGKRKTGTLNSLGYIKIMINKKEHKAHRLIFLYHHGYLPDEIDHIDGDRANNLISNLRECTREQNTRNSKIPSTNKSGVKGVYWHTQHKKWYAQLTVSGKQMFLGLFDDLNNAKKTIDEYRLKYHKEFSNNGGGVGVLL
jgi:hypothetical protein